MLDDLPLKFHDNEYIKTNYRMHYRGYREVLISAFHCHNESFNIWSHFLGKCVALLFAIFILAYYPNMEKFATHGAS